MTLNDRTIPMSEVPSPEIDLGTLLAEQATLTEEERMVHDSVLGWVKSRFMPGVDQRFLEGTSFAGGAVSELAELGVFGATLEGYGCAGMGDVAHGLAMEAFEYGDSGLRSFVSVQSSLAMYALYRYGSDEQKERWLPRMARGEKIGCFGLTEPDWGSDPGSMVTKARRSDTGYILNGAKMWITASPFADLAIVWAKLEGDDPKDIRGFIVEKGTPGYSAPTMEGKLSLRSSVTGEIVLQDCEIPSDALLPEASGLGAPLGCLNQARYGIAWGAVGAARACFDVALDYARSRPQFGEPIAAKQLVQAKLVEMATTIVNARLMALHVGRLKERGEALPFHVSMAKRHNVAGALEVARTARQILGANGIIAEYAPIRHMLNLESVITYEGTHEVHTLILGRGLTGLHAF